MSLTWEFLQSQTISKPMTEQFRRPDPVSGNRKPTTMSTFDKPQEIVQLAAQSIAASDLSTIQGTITSYGATQNYTMADGVTFTGLPEGETHKRIEGTHLYDITLNVRRTDF